MGCLVIGGWSRITGHETTSIRSGFVRRRASDLASRRSPPRGLHRTASPDSAGPRRRPATGPDRRAGRARRRDRRELDSRPRGTRGGPPGGEETWPQGCPTDPRRGDARTTTRSSPASTRSSNALGFCWSSCTLMVLMEIHCTTGNKRWFTERPQPRRRRVTPRRGGSHRRRRSGIAPNRRRTRS